MNSPVRVGDVGTFDALRGALVQFGEASQETLALFEARISRAASRLEDIERECRAWVRRCKADVAAASDDGEDDLQRAWAELAEAEERLAGVRRARRQLDDVANGFLRSRRRFSDFLRDELPRATAELVRLSGNVNAYLGIRQAGVGSESAVAYANTSAAAAAGAGGRSFPGSGSRRALTVEDVPVDRIDVSDSHVHGPADFRKYSYKEIVDGFDKLESVVRPQVARGATGEDFSQLDAERGLSYAVGYRRIYDSFYGEDRIVLDRVGNRLIVTNGYHRLFVARALGIGSVPAAIRGEPTSPPSMSS